MTIIFNEGDRFWIEQHTVNVTLTDAAGFVDSALTAMHKSGTIVGYNLTPGLPVNNDNSQAVALISLLDQGSGTIVPGESITGFIVRITKQIGTAGNTVIAINVMLLVRGEGL